jgi:hypothetical protein
MECLDMRIASFLRSRLFELNTSRIIEDKIYDVLKFPFYYILSFLHFASTLHPPFQILPSPCYLSVFSGHPMDAHQAKPQLRLRHLPLSSDVVVRSCPKLSQ